MDTNGNGAIHTTLGACIDAEPSLTRLAAYTWPVKTAYHLAKLVRLLREETKAFEEQRIKLVRELGTARPPTEVELTRGIRDEVIEVPPERFKDYSAQYLELRAVTTEIAWRPLSLDILEQQKEPIAAADLVDLGPFLDDGINNEPQHQS
jgi:hypothetical protein